MKPKQKIIRLFYRGTTLGEKELTLRLEMWNYGIDILPVLRIEPTAPEWITIDLGWLIFHARLCYRAWELPF